MGVLMGIRRALGGWRGQREDAAPATLERQPGDQDDDRFATLVADALDELPDEFLRVLEDVPVVISDRGAEEHAYGLYRGASVAHPDFAAQIVIFRDTLLRDFGDDPAALQAEVRRTVRHELGHHLGFGERGVDALGL